MFSLFSYSRHVNYFGVSARNDLDVTIAGEGDACEVMKTAELDRTKYRGNKLNNRALDRIRGVPVRF